MNNYRQLFIIGALFLAVTAMTAEIEDTFEGRIESPMNFALEVTYQPIAFERVRSGLGNVGTGNILGLSFEWMPLQRYGKLSLGAVFGGGGASISNSGSEQAALLLLMGEVFAAYRLDFLEGQILVPYVRVSKSLVYSQEENKLEQWHRRSLPLYDGQVVSVGGEVLLDWIDKSSDVVLDSSYGVNSVYLLAEYRRMTSSGQSMDFDSQWWRMGLRFEF